MNRILSILAICSCCMNQAYAEVITSAGSTTVQPAMRACAKLYQQSHPNTQIIIAGGGSSKGISTVARGKVDIGRASRPIKAKEQARYTDLQSYVIGSDGIAMIVHADNPIKQLTSTQVEQLFKGKIKDWHAINGNQGEVHLISLGSEHGTYELFSKKFHLQGKQTEDGIDFEQGHAWIAFSQDVMIDKVAHDPLAIGFASIGIVHEKAAETGIKALLLDTVVPIADNVRNGSYT